MTRFTGGDLQSPIASDAIAAVNRDQDRKRDTTERLTRPPSAPRVLCRMCQELGCPADAHIIPNGLFHPLVRERKSEALHTVPFDVREREKQKRTAAWDDAILCRACETEHQRYDDHAIKVLRQTPSVPAQWGDEHDLWLPQGDSNRLGMFLLHVMWRAHESQRGEFARFTLGAVAEKLRRYLRAHDTQALLLLPCNIGWLRADPDNLHQMCMTPTPSRWAPGGRCWVWQLGRWQFSTSDGLDAVPADLKRFVIRPGQPVRVRALHREFRISLGFQVHYEAWLTRRLAEEQDSQ